MSAEDRPDPTGADFARLFAQLKLPAMPDMEAVLAAHRRNLEALNAANRVALDGAQAVARRNMEIVQQTVAELSETLRELSSAEAPQDKAARQAELMKAAYERAVGNLREISELIQKSNTEALGLINQRFAEALAEVQALLAKKPE